MVKNVIMGIFKGGINVGEVAKDVLNKIDDSTLTLQEQADKTIDMMERLGITPSSKTRRQVTWFLLSYLALWNLLTAGAYYFNEVFGDKLLELFKEFTSNSIILSITAFFYGGYYITKNIGPALKAKIENKKAENQFKLKEKEVNLSRKENRIIRRNNRRN